MCFPNTALPYVPMKEKIRTQCWNRQAEPRLHGRAPGTSRAMSRSDLQGITLVKGSLPFGLFSREGAGDVTLASVSLFFDVAPPSYVAGVSREGWKRRRLSDHSSRKSRVLGINPIHDPELQLLGVKHVSAVMLSSTNAK